VFSPRADTEFQRHWNRNFLTVSLPGFVVFGLGAATNINVIVVAGWLVVLASMVRSLILIVKYRRCSGCRRVNGPRLNGDTCLYCGADLPLDGPV
jgi:hypothetical protein